MIQLSDFDCTARHDLRGVAPRAARERFWEYVAKGAERDCWLWTGYKTTHGYGYLSLVWPKQMNISAHRMSYELHHNTIVPSSVDVCHTCDVRLCVNPAHLWLGTRRDNMQDAVAKGRINNGQSVKTHCAHGHEFSSTNTRWRPTGGRSCRECARIRAEQGRDPSRKRRNRRIR